MNQTYLLWHHNGQPLAQSAAAAIARYEQAHGVAPSLILAPPRDAARIQEVTRVTVQPDRACLSGHIMVGCLLASDGAAREPVEKAES